MPEFRKTLDVSPTGVRHEVVIEDDKLYTVEYTPSSIESEILDSCAEMRSLAQRRDTSMQFAARIPINTYMIWKGEHRKHMREGGSLTWAQFEVMKLNSRENCNLRVGNQRSAFGKRL